MWTQMADINRKWGHAGDHCIASRNSSHQRLHYYTVHWGCKHKAKVPKPRYWWAQLRFSSFFPPVSWGQIWVDSVRSRSQGVFSLGVELASALKNKRKHIWSWMISMSWRSIPRAKEFLVAVATGTEVYSVGPQLVLSLRLPWSVHA